MKNWLLLGVDVLCNTGNYTVRFQYIITKDIYIYMHAGDISSLALCYLTTVSSYLQVPPWTTTVCDVLLEVFYLWWVSCVTKGSGGGGGGEGRVLA